MEGILIKKVSSIVQYKDSLFGVSFNISGKNIADVELHKEKSFNELCDTMKNTALGISLHTSTGYLVHVRLPFTGRRKIRLVINNELAGILPFEVEDAVTDFQELGKGNVLAASMSKEALDVFKDIKGLRHLTVNSLAALYALKWFKALPQTDYIFLSIDENVASIIAFKSDTLQTVRHFFYSPGSDTLNEAIRELSNDENLSNTLFYMVSNNEDRLAEKEGIEKSFNIRVSMPSPEKYIKSDEYPPWLWAAVGSALLSLNPREEINLLSLKRSEISLPTRLLFVYTGCLAGLCILALFLFSLNAYSKTRVLAYLNGEQNRIFRTAFPKSPPMKDVNKFFEDRIKAMDREAVSGSGINVGMPPLQVLAEISMKVDNQLDVKINEFTSDEREFAISGSTVSFAAVEKLKSAIEEIRDIKDVEIQNIDIAAGKQVRFRIRGRI
jgi:hypothetical protein